MLIKPKSQGVYQALFKLIMIGDSGTGKSSLINRYMKDQFDLDYKVTIGVEFAAKKIDIDENYRIKLQIWDTAGQESFRSIVKSFYRNATAVILVYSIANKKSFQSLNQWIKQARQCSPSNAIMILMATHKDLQDYRQVTKEQAEQFMKEEQIALFFQTSSKSAQNVNMAFDEVGKQLFLNMLSNRKQALQSPQQKKKLDLGVQQRKMFDCC